MMASFINSLGFSRVVTKDAHSYVLEAVVDNLYNVEQYVCAQHLPKHDVLVAPDNGASKKIYKVAQRMSADVVIADKRRDNTGKIVDVSVDTSVISPSSSVCVVDDLCDYGNTFLELGKELRRTLKSNTMNLYVTHGFFGKGVDDLLKLYDNIYVHNLMNKDVEHSVKII
jgi:ribose-phosphate pyrophosphokinase